MIPIEVLVAIIAAASSVLGGVLTAVINNKLLEYRIKIVEREVETIDNLASRVLAVELRLASLDEKISDLKESLRK